MTLTSPPVDTELASTLRLAADHLADLPHRRVAAGDVHKALRCSTSCYWQAQGALLALFAYLRILGENTRWLHVGGGPQSRDLAVDRLRAAAEHSETAEAVAR